MTLFGKGGGDSNPFCWCTLESVLLLSSTVLVPGAVSSCPNQAYDNGCDGRRWGVSIEGVFAVQANLEAQVSLKGQRWKCLHTSACMCISFFFSLLCVAFTVLIHATAQGLNHSLAGNRCILRKNWLLPFRPVNLLAWICFDPISLNDTKHTTYPARGRGQGTSEGRREKQKNKNLSSPVALLCNCSLCSMNPGFCFFRFCLTCFAVLFFISS